MVQVATLLGSVLSGLRDARYPPGHALYAVRRGPEFLYIGQTHEGAWKRLRYHVLRAENAFGTTVRAQWLAAAEWRVEVCYMYDEPGIPLLEAALIRRYCPPLNRAHNMGVPDPMWERTHLYNPDLLGPSGQHILAHHWPSFQEIVLEPPEWQRRLTQSQRRR